MSLLLWQMVFGKNKSDKASDYFSPEMLARIKDAVHEAEMETCGEIRVKIIKECDKDLRTDADMCDDYRVYEQALREFEREGMHNTREKTGIMVLLVLHEKRFQILADSGIYAKLSQEWWNHKAELMAGYFKEGNYARGLCEVVSHVGRELANHFPKRSNDVNELPDDVVIEE